MRKRELNRTPFLNYSLPIREGFIGKITLPVDLTEQEAERVCRIVMTLVFPFQNINKPKEAASEPVAE